jgi:hypothetical protein
MYLEGGHHDGFVMSVTDSSFSGSGARGYGIQFGHGAPEGRRLTVLRSSIGGSTAALFSDAPFVEEGVSGVGPPLTIAIFDSSVGEIDLNRHYLECVRITRGREFYADTCPPGDWTPID